MNRKYIEIINLKIFIKLFILILIFLKYIFTLEYLNLNLSIIYLNNF